MSIRTHVIAIAVAAVAAAGCGKKEDGAKTAAPKTEAPVPPPKTEKPPEPEAPPIGTEEVSYQSGDTIMKGFLAYPADDARHPSVLVVHEWWGHNDYTRARAKQLAEMGYTALAVDMYGNGKTAAHPGDAQKFMMEVLDDIPGAEKRFAAARERLVASEHADPERVAAIGYCFGGAVVLHMARTGADLDLVASFHGNLSTQQPMKNGAFKGKILVFHGAADPFTPQEQVDAFKKEMDDAGADYTFTGYEGAKHGFTNPGATDLGKKFELPLEYDADADTASWKAFSEALAQVTAK